MPRRGPKRATTRDDRDVERRAERNRQRTLALEKKCQVAADATLEDSKMKRNPNMPTNKGERRALREALSAEGISLEQWAANNDESLYTLARDKYVSVGVAPSVSEEDKDAANDSRVKEFMHLPETNSEKTKVEVPAQPQTQKTTRSFAKALAEGRRNLSNSDITAETKPSSASIVPFSSSDALENLPVDMVPTGNVYIVNKKGEKLCVNAKGTLEWKNGANDASQDANWLVKANTTDGKFTIRSSYGLYLSHCLMWGLVADRNAASGWEQFEISATNGDLAGEQAVVFTVKTWRGQYICNPTAANSKPTTSSTSDANNNLKFVKIL